MICRFCGEEFEPNKRGIKSDVCKKEECRRLRKNEVQKNYLERKKEKVEIIKEDNIICRKENYEDFGYIVEMARKLGSLRFELVTEIMKLQEEIKQTNEVEQDLLHMVENAECMNEGEVISSLKLIKQNRNKRRGLKDRYFLLSNLINGITIKNPEKFVRKGIEMVRSQSYNYKVIENILNNELNEKEEVQ